MRRLLRGLKSRATKRAELGLVARGLQMLRQRIFHRPEAPRYSTTEMRVIVTLGLQAPRRTTARGQRTVMTDRPQSGRRRPLSHTQPGAAPPNIARIRALIAAYRLPRSRAGGSDPYAGVGCPLCVPGVVAQSGIHCRCRPDAGAGDRRQRRAVRRRRRPVAPVPAGPATRSARAPDHSNRTRRRQSRNVVPAVRRASSAHAHAAAVRRHIGRRSDAGARGIREGAGGGHRRAGVRQFLRGPRRRRRAGPRAGGIRRRRGADAGGGPEPSLLAAALRRSGVGDRSTAGDPERSVHDRRGGAARVRRSRRRRVAGPVGPGGGTAAAVGGARPHPDEQRRLDSGRWTFE